MAGRARVVDRAAGIRCCRLACSRPRRRSIDTTARAACGARTRGCARGGGRWRYLGIGDLPRDLERVVEGQFGRRRWDCGFPRSDRRCRAASRRRAGGRRFHVEAGGRSGFPPIVRRRRIGRCVEVNGCSSDAEAACAGRRYLFAERRYLRRSLAPHSFVDRPRSVPPRPARDRRDAGPPLRWYLRRDLAISVISTSGATMPSICKGGMARGRMEIYVDPAPALHSRRAATCS
jgi:hypothetical protein